MHLFFSTPIWTSKIKNYEIVNDNMFNYIINLQKKDSDGVLKSNFKGWHSKNFELHSKSINAAFIYFGDQFINFAKGRNQEPDDRRHFGIAVDDKELVRETLVEMGVELLDGRFLDFLDPWGNRVEITTYRNIQFSKADYVLRGMGLAHLEKTKTAIEELTKKGMAP